MVKSGAEVVAPDSAHQKDLVYPSIYFYTPSECPSQSCMRKWGTVGRLLPECGKIIPAASKRISVFIAEETRETRALSF